MTSLPKHKPIHIPSFIYYTSLMLLNFYSIQPLHAGIIACTNDRNWEALANRINAAITAEESLQGKLIRVVRPTLSP